jgi:hypothetical protein
MSALKQLLDLVHVEDPIAAAPANLLEVQLAAIQERLDQRRKQIRVLDQRATDRGVETVRNLDDVASLLFSDATYKSYPESFLDQKRWDRLTTWFQTLSSDPLGAADVKSVETLDDWFAALREIGIWVNSSSGTSGKSSFLSMNQTDMDVALKLMDEAMAIGSTNRRKAAPHSFTVFVMGPASASYSGSIRSKMFAEWLGRPGDIHYISEVGQTAQEGLDLAKLNRAIAAGTAKPSEIQAVQEKGRERAVQIRADMERFTDKLLANLDKPIAILGLSSMFWQVMEIAKARGHARVPLHPGSVTAVSGGRKGTKLPDDYLDQLRDYFGMTDDIYTNPYGMTEMSGCCPSLRGGNAWAIPPWIVPIVLTETDETVLNPADGKGEATGRFAFFDLLVEGRWGALVTGDQVTIDFSPSEPGVNVPLIRKVDRYKDLPGDDKATCAGTIDAYVRGALEPA